MTDEPLLESTAPETALANASGDEHAVRDRIERLAREQPCAVLCTQGEGQPYGWLVALAVSEDLRSAVLTLDGARD